MATVKFENASRIYPGTNRAAVDRLNLDVKDGEFLVLVGPSGCGKSTSLRMLAGLEDINEGSIYIGDKDVSELPPKQRDIAMVFQNYALYPQMTVAENMGFALKIAKAPKSEIETRVKEAARMLDLDQYLERYPRALSGGQRQRVAMGRAIVREPQVFLMDEPLSNLDAKLRVSTRAEIAALQRRLGITTFYVTHDQVEAMTMGDRVAVLKDGLLQQVAVPLELYDRPANRFVATFIGSPQMNIMRATVTDGRARRRVSCAPNCRRSRQLPSPGTRPSTSACVPSTSRSVARTARDFPASSTSSRSSDRRSTSSPTSPSTGRNSASSPARWRGSGGCAANRFGSRSIPGPCTCSRSTPAFGWPTPRPCTCSRSTPAFGWPTRPCRRWSFRRKLPLS